MGARRRRGRVLALAALLAAAARVGASVQVDPIARLSLEGGYDSNVLYDGRGGDGMGRVSPDLGLQLRDHDWSLRAQGGGDLLMYQQRGRSPVWNQRGRLELHALPEARLAVDGDLSATYAPDPIGLARFGIFGRSGAALIAGARARAAYRLDRDWTLAGTFAERTVRFAAGDGAASHTPGLELSRQLSARTRLGGAYRLDLFQGFGPGAALAVAHEVLGLARWRWTRHLTWEAEAGPALWTSRGGGASYVVPQGALQLLGLDRRLGELRLGLRHGVGLGNLATPGLFDSAEAAFTVRLSRSFRLHADGGLWRSGAIPWGAGGVLGYGAQGELAWLAGSGLEVGLGGSRFARLDPADSTYDRTIVGLRVGWELRHR